MKYVFFFLSCLLPWVAYSEDIELYLGNESTTVGITPKVLIIFDNSGSMNREVTINAPYDPDRGYNALDGLTKLSEEYIYFSKGSGVGDSPLPTPDSATEQRRFFASILSCDFAHDILKEKGFVNVHLREYTFKGSSGTWEEIPDNTGANLAVVDCLEDIEFDRLNGTTERNINHGSSGVYGNPYGNLDGKDLAPGYPADGLGNKDNPQQYTSNIDNALSTADKGEVVTLFTDNYLRYALANSNETETVSKLEAAKRAVVNVVESFYNVDFGLQIFNLNHAGENVRDGGRIVMGIQEMNVVTRARLLEILESDVDGETNTPLCETLFEASRYFGGLSVYYGDKDSDRGNYIANTPPRDLSIETNTVYKSPFGSTFCGDNVHVIMITDGAPTRDRAANDEIALMTGYNADLVRQVRRENSSGSLISEDNYLVALADILHNQDINANVSGKQNITLNTIGFALQDFADPDNPTNDELIADDAKKLLDAAAEAGGGNFYDVDNPSALSLQLSEALRNALSVNATFTAPAVASNNFDRTQTLDSVYYAMFLPERRPRWAGNIKKLKISGSGLVGKDDKPALNDAGNIEENVTTIWSSSNDGADVNEGGVVEMFQTITPDSRKVYSDLGSDSAIKEFSKDNAESAFETEAKLAAFMKVPEADLDDLFAWAKGADVDDDDNDESTTDMRKDVFGDPLHSRPLVVNYGGSADNQDVRIIVGTNAGALHMFQDEGNSVKESWVFMPKEFFSNYNELRINANGGGKVYGLDGTPVSYIDDGGDGTVDHTKGDKAWVFVGSRRGGSSYYALDISNPDVAPKLLWHINDDSTGFSELGQSWSTPRVINSLINTDSGKAKPTLVFAAGYAASKDAGGVGTNDTLGRGLFFVDAASGEKKLAITPGGDIDFPGNDSIPAAVSALDSDSDGFVDRLYFGDTGGVVWRLDMVGASSDDWGLIQLASLGRQAEGNKATEANDRRFFSEPTITRALISETFKYTTIVNGNSDEQVHQSAVPYDAILIGSGNRADPLNTITNDMLFMIKDGNIITQKFDTPPSEVKLADLHDYTGNPFGDNSLTEQEQENLALAVSEKDGWFISLLGNGEKSVTQPEAIAGVAYYNSFIPTFASEGTCALDGGEAQLYAVDLALGTTIYETRIIELPGIINEKPTIVTRPPTTDDDESDPDNPKETDQRTEVVLLAPDEKTICDANGNCDGLKLKTMRTALYVEEDN
ncbi:pilus assembly protein [Thalassotalea euphylliae]|uniref:rRNA (Guanine-N1)-methyltransferase n=1 Tax=Thalassotalea euphylliae TaxID=1655234 RepID=A0A3E0U076_9GAMM|nr:PilC/PilY family type IV pilus protein [Thalassotalea euphylliae]REL30318.1 rRNA (guanine-N1)-methyltransferase [Thalassotalea euphylliae]